MKIPISKRLLCCAEMLPPDSRVADIGCDHGYLGIYLAKNRLARHVICSDLRQKPLQRAENNALAFGVSQELEFRLGSGLQTVMPGEIDAVVCAGMGGELIAQLLDSCGWICSPQYTLILQPQASGNDLRRWLGQNRFSIVEERLVIDGRFLYSVLRAQYGAGAALTPGQQYVSAAVLNNAAHLLAPYLQRVHSGLLRAVHGLSKSKDVQRLRYYEAALAEVEEVIRQYGDSQTNFGVLKDPGASGL